MAKLLTPLSIIGPGALGLNTKLAGLELGPDWCVDVRNGALSNQGTISSRKGWRPFPDAEQIAGAPDVVSIIEYIDTSTDGRMIWSAGNKIYESTGNYIDVTGSVTPEADNWKFVNFNGKVVGVQAEHNPIVKVDSQNFSEISFDGSIDFPIEALAAWGRIWYVEGNRQRIRYTDLLQENVVDDASNPGSAGQLNMYTVWANGTDEIVALAEFNNYLVVFGRKQVILFKGGEDPNNLLQIVDIINTTGCVARDSVQNIGNDLIFLGEDGVISLGRNIQAGGDIRSLPISNLTENVSSFITQFALSEQGEAIKSAYKPDEGFYLISFPTSKVVFYLSLRYLTPDNKARIFVWYDINPTGMAVDREDTLYFGQPGYLGFYDGYRDNTESYEFTMRTGWTTGITQGESDTKVFKQAVLTVRGGYSSFVSFNWSYDFLPTAYDTQTQASAEQAEPAEWNIAEYGVGEYSRISLISQLVYTMSGSGKAVQFGVTANIDGSQLTVQKVDLYLKGGNISRRGRR